MKQSFYPALIACLAILPLLAAPAVAYDQPTVNLGLTSFLDGLPPAGPGFYFAEYVESYHSSKFVDGPPHSSLDVWASINQFLYQSDTPVLLDGKWGLDVIVPLVNANVDSPALTDDGAGLGDLLVGPYLQWDPIMGDNGPLFAQRVELQTIFPTGKYNHKDNINPGSNFFSFNPYWAGTLWVLPQLSVSARVHYLWNARNNDPVPAYNTTQAGQAAHINFAASYEFLPKQLQAGLNGYYFKQLSDSQINGDSVPGHEQVLGLGPGAIYSFSKDTHLFFNAYWESNVQNRPEGERFVLRLVHHF
jgi:hypothetical protein